MALTRSFIRDAATTPLDARLANMALIVANGDGTPRTGVLETRSGIVTALGTMHVAVAAATFATSKGRADGVAIFANDGPVNVAIPAAPASNSRIDVIWVKHNDTETGDANSQPTFGVTSGAAAASPTKPGIPTGALELATLRVYAGTTAADGGSNTLTETYRMTTTQGGVVPFRTKTDLDLWTNAADGQLAIALDDASGAALYMWNGVAWKRSSRVLAKVSTVPAVQSGIVADTNITGASVTFDLPVAGDVRVSGGIQIYGTPTSAAAVIRVKEGTTIHREITRMANSSPGAAATSSYLDFETVVALAAGTHTLRLTIERAVGTNVTVSPTATSPTQLVAEILD